MRKCSRGKNRVSGCVVTTQNVSTRNLPLEADNAATLVYPNPSGGRFTLQLQYFPLQKTDVAVYDAKGTLVQKRSFQLAQNTSVNFDLKGRAPGLYLIKVAGRDGIKTLKVLLVNERIRMQ